MSSPTRQQANQQPEKKKRGRPVGSTKPRRGAKRQPLEVTNPHQWTVGQRVVWSRNTDKKNVRIEHAGTVVKIFRATLTVEFMAPTGKLLKTVRKDSCIPA